MGGHRGGDMTLGLPRCDWCQGETWATRDRAGRSGGLSPFTRGASVWCAARSHGAAGELGHEEGGSGRSLVRLPVASSRHSYDISDTRDPRFLARELSYERS